MAQNREDYHFYKRLGICVSCGKNKAAMGKVRCEECLAKVTNAVNKNRKEKTDEQKEFDRLKKNAYMRELRARKKQNGVCQWCNKPLSQYSNLFCIDCRVKSLHNNRRRSIAT